MNSNHPSKLRRQDKEVPKQDKELAVTLTKVYKYKGNWQSVGNISIRTHGLTDYVELLSHQQVSSGCIVFSPEDLSMLTDLLVLWKKNLVKLGMLEEKYPEVLIDESEPIGESEDIGELA